MAGYTYPHPSLYSMGRDYPDRGDGFGPYYGLTPIPGSSTTKSYRKSYTKKTGSQDDITHTRSRSHSRARSRSRSLSQTRTKSRSRSRSRSRCKSRSRSSSRTRTRSRSHSRSSTRCHRDLKLKEPRFLDAFRVMYLTPSKHKNNTMYLATKKREDRIQDLLKSDGLGSKRWTFYPRKKKQAEPIPKPGVIPGKRDNCDQRIKVEAEFFRKYKKSMKVDTDAPVTKLKRWELILYKKMGFLQAVQ